MKNKKYPLISVVMLNYNGLEYLKKTIKPILNQDYPNFEFIIVDNGSTDGSLEYIKKFKKIRLVLSPSKRNKNFACNYAIDRANGKYILLLDNDLMIRDNLILKNLIDLVHNSDSLGCLSLSFFDKRTKKSQYYGGFFSYYFKRKMKSKIRSKIRKMHGSLIGYPNGAAIFIKKSIWEKIGGYDPYLKFGGDDNDLGIKLWLNGYKNYLYSKTTQLHLGTAKKQNCKKYSLKWKDMVYAHLYTIVKNYKFINTIIILTNFSVFGFLASVKQSIFYFRLEPIIAFFQGYYLFLKNIPNILKKREKIQLERTIKEDIFLKIKPPKFN